ncbi:hypothetical protein D3C73_1613610 [compost metagenome]
MSADIEGLSERFADPPADFDDILRMIELLNQYDKFVSAHAAYRIGLADGMG